MTGRLWRIYSPLVALFFAVASMLPSIGWAAPELRRLDASRLAVDAAGEIDRVLSEVINQYGDNWPMSGVVVEVPAGYWRLERPLTFEKRHSGRIGAPLVLRGQAGGLSILSGAIPLEPLERVPSRMLSRLGGDAARSVKAYGLPEREVVLPALQDRQGQGYEARPMGSEPYFPGHSLRLARWPNDEFAKAQPAAAGFATRDPDGVRGPSRAWAQASDLWVHGYWGHDWADEWIPVLGVEGEHRSFAFQGGLPKYGLRAGAPYRIYNVVEELDEPGEWYADPSQNLVLVWPPAGVDLGTLNVSSLTVLVEFKDVSHVRLEHLVLEGARGDAVVVSGGYGVTLERCLIRHVGLRAVRLSGVAHRLIDSDVRDTGQGGVVLWGGSRQTLEPAGLVVQGTRFSNFNRWVRTYRPAILVGGVGQQVRSNLIQGGPHTGIMFYGNDHLIAENVLRGLATETGDVGAVYTGMDWTARGTVIRHNVLQDIRGPGLHGSRGIYLDDQASGITVQGNVFVRVDQAVFLGGGKDNLVDGNLFVASTPAIHLDDRGMTWQRNQTLAPDGVLRRRLEEVPWRGAAYARYPGLSALLEREPGLPTGNVARRNAVVDGEPFHFQGGAKPALQVDRLFGKGELRFDAGPPLATRDFGQLEPAPDSPAVRDGFPLLPWDRMRCTLARWQGVPPGGLPRDEVAECRAARR
jgi:Right handed beta helix region